MGAEQFVEGAAVACLCLSDQALLGLAIECLGLHNQPNTLTSAMDTLALSPRSSIHNMT